MDSPCKEVHDFGNHPPLQHELERVPAQIGAACRTQVAAAASKRARKEYDVLCAGPERKVANIACSPLRPFF